MTTQPLQTSFARRLALFAGDIKISHTLFAMPWALLAMVLAGHDSVSGLTAGKILLILICMIAARTAAMSANRVLDSKLDAANPRTARRAIPAGELSARFVASAWSVSSIVFIAACVGFWIFYGNPWPAILAIPVLAFVAAYPLLKRFTRLCHYYLGMALGLAPVCAYVAVSGRISLAPVLMGAAVLLWTAGFDIIYACQDIESDRQAGLFSAPARLGIGGALWVSRATHAVCLALLVIVGLIVPEFRVFYWIAIGLVSVLLIVEHNIVKPDDLSKVGHAFFTVNGIISVAVGILGIVDIVRS
jgi:4-hydroxybenzoate polyprenyltransferase